MSAIVKNPASLAAIIVALAGLTLMAMAQQRVKEVKITPEKSEAEVGRQIKLTAIGIDESGKALDLKPMLWVAIPSDLAAADDSGAISFFAPGEVRVIAIIGGKPGYATISVKPSRVTRIEIGGVTGPVIAGSSTRLTTTAFGANGDPRTDSAVNWKSDNTAIAIVDAAGLLTGIAPGKAKIKAEAEGATVEITIEVVKSSVKSLSISPQATNARTGDVIRFNVTAKDAGGKSIGAAATRWAVSGEGAMIEQDGGLVADRPGTYLVSASLGDQTAVASVIVAPREIERSLEVVGRIKLKNIQAAEQWIFGNYLYVSTIWDQIQVYDISDPSQPRLTDTVKFDARTVNDVSLTPDGKIAVITREGASGRKNGIVFLDTSDPAHPKALSEYTETVTGGVHSAFIDGHYVYLTDDATGSLRIIDFKDVKNPKEAARWQVEARGPGVAGSATGGMFSEGRYLHDVQVMDGLAYLAYWRDGLVILDVGKGIKGGSPEKPVFVSQIRFNHHELYGNGWIAGTHEVYRYKNYVFVGDEVFPEEFNVYDKARIPARGVLHVVDVSDIFHPRKVAEYGVPEGGSHNVWVRDDVLVMGYYGGGGRVLDVSGELRGDLYRQGREIARLWTGDPEGFRPNLPFAWGARQFGEFIFFNDVNSGIWIVKLGKPVRKGSTTSPGQ